MVDYYDYEGEVPDVEIQDMREDFEAIWSKNAVDVELIRFDNEYDVVENADFFGTNTRSVVTKKIIKMNIQISSANPDRVDAGVRKIDTYHCYVRWNEEIKLTDKIRFINDYKLGAEYLRKGDTFIVQNVSGGIHHGQYAFHEFDIKKIDNQEFNTK